jgi:CysZ protein
VTERRRRVSRARSLWYGFTLPYAALRLVLATPTLLFWSLLPIVLTMALYVWVIAVLQAWTLAQLLSLLTLLGFDPTGGIAWTAGMLAWMILVLVGALTFAFVSTIVAAPFNDRLAARTERHAVPPIPPPARGGQGGQLHLIWIDLVKTIAATVAGFAAIVLALVPVVNAFCVVAVCLLVCFQYTSYPQTRRHVGLASGAYFLVRHAWACTGFGAVVSALFAIPILQSLALPLAVVGGTLLVARAPGDARLPALR